MSDDLARVARKPREQREFDLGKMDLGAGPDHAAVGEIHANRTECNHGFTVRAGRAPAQRGAHPRQQFTDAEGLGEVVVGPRIERLYLVDFVSARRQHYDRQRRPGAKVAPEIHAVQIRQAEVEYHQIRLAGGGFGQTLASGLRVEHAHAFRFQRGAQEPPDLLFVLDHDDHRCALGHVVSAGDGEAGCSSGGCGMSGGEPSGNATTKRAPPVGTFSAQIRPRWAATIARLMVRPRPTPGVADSRSPRANFSNIVSSLPGARPGPLSATLMRNSAPCLAASMRISLRSGVYLAAFSSKLHSTRSISTASNSTSGRSCGRSMRIVREASRCSRAFTALPTTSSSGCHWRLSRTSPACSRAMSSRLFTRAFILMASSRIAPAISCWLPESPGRVSVSDSARPSSAVRGVRRSCDSALRIEFRSRSDSILTRASCATIT